VVKCRLDLLRFDQSETLEGQQRPIISELFNVVPQLDPFVILLPVEKARDVGAKQIVNLLDASVAVGELAHPLDAATNANHATICVCCCR
jgi:hypothetical protein